jgi:hypothetical protein
VPASIPARITPFWCALPEAEVESTGGDGQVVLLSATPSGRTVSFRRVPEPKTTRNKVHRNLVEVQKSAPSRRSA